MSQPDFGDDRKHQVEFNPKHEHGKTIDMPTVNEVSESVKNFTVDVEAKESANVQPSVSYPVHPNFSSKSARMKSFEGWPEHKRQKPEDLAEAGLFYVGEEDKTTCYYCGGGLKDWVAADDPWQQHALWFGSYCPYIRLNKELH